MNVGILFGMIAGAIVFWALGECFFAWAEEWGRPRAGDENHPLTPSR